jgi:hypothetical protein
MDATTIEVNFETITPPEIAVLVRDQCQCVEYRPPRRREAIVRGELGRDGVWRPTLRALYFDGVSHPIPADFGLGGFNSRLCEDEDREYAMRHFARRCDGIG